MPAKADKPLPKKKVPAIVVADHFASGDDDDAVRVTVPAEPAKAKKPVPKKKAAQAFESDTEDEDPSDDEQARKKVLQDMKAAAKARGAKRRKSDTDDEDEEGDRPKKNRK